MSQNPDGMRQTGLYHWTLVMGCWWSWGCARMRHHAERACCPVTLGALLRRVLLVCGSFRFCLILYVRVGGSALYAYLFPRLCVSQVESAERLARVRTPS